MRYAPLWPASLSDTGITRHPEDVTAILSSTVTFTCETNLQDATFTWWDNPVYAFMSVPMPKNYICLCIVHWKCADKLIRDILFFILLAKLKLKYLYLISKILTRVFRYKNGEAVDTTAVTSTSDSSTVSVGPLVGRSKIWCVAANSQGTYVSKTGYYKFNMQIT